MNQRRADTSAAKSAKAREILGDQAKTAWKRARVAWVQARDKRAASQQVCATLTTWTSSGTAKGLDPPAILYAASCLVASAEEIYQVGEAVRTIAEIAQERAEEMAGQSFDMKDYDRHGKWGLVWVRSLAARAMGEVVMARAREARDIAEVAKKRANKALDQVPIVAWVAGYAARISMAKAWTSNEAADDAMEDAGVALGVVERTVLEATEGLADNAQDAPPKNVGPIGSGPGEGL